MKRKSGALDRDETEAREFQTAHSGLFFKVDKVIYKTKSNYQTIEIVRNKYYGKVLFLDGLVQTTELDEFYYHEMLVHPALACHKKPNKVLIIGGGDGGALREVLKHPVKKATMVEIDRSVVEACYRYFPWLKKALKDPRVELVVEDGNNFVARAGAKFDVIIVDSSDPVGPSTVLHEENFYRKLKHLLEPEGIIAAQAGSLMLHFDSQARKKSFLKKLFRQAHFYLGPVPTYPVGMWCYNFLSDEVDPRRLERLRIPAGLKYYNREIHQASFALPNFFKKNIAVKKYWKRT